MSADYRTAKCRYRDIYPGERQDLGHSATNHRAAEDGREPGATFPAPVEEFLSTPLTLLSNCAWHSSRSLETNPGYTVTLVQIWFIFKSVNIRYEYYIHPSGLSQTVVKHEVL